MSAGTRSLKLDWCAEASEMAAQLSRAQHAAAALGEELRALAHAQTVARACAHLLHALPPSTS